MMKNNEVMKAYKKAIARTPLFSKDTENYPPLTYEDSLSSVPNYPFCTMGVLTAEADWGTRKGIAFVVEDNYLLTSASNCYSHKHGEYSNITFTIASNRKHGSDTYKVANVFNPKRYKYEDQQYRNQHNYALLYIQGEPNLKDIYGNLKIVKDSNSQESFTYQCSINSQDELEVVAELRLSTDIKNMPSKFLLDGMPRIQWNNISAEVDGLIVQNSKRLEPYSIKFGKKMENQLGQWVRGPKSLMKLYEIPAQGLNMSCFEGKVSQPIDKIQIHSCKANDQKISEFFKQIPFSHIQSLILGHCQEQIRFGFLAMDKFANLKQLIIKKQYQDSYIIGPNGCKNIALLPLPNLRKLVLTRHKIGDKGCQYLSTGKWPFLQILSLSFCKITSIGLQYLINGKFKNLVSLDLLNNDLGQEVSQTLEKADFPRLNVLNLAKHNPNRFNIVYFVDLRFLRAPSWRQLRDVDLNNCLVGNYGCKMLRQSACILSFLKLDNCKISALGVKWLCKANTSKMITLSLIENKIGYQGCLYLTKANFPALAIFIYHTYGHPPNNGRKQKIKNVTPRGFRRLLSAEHRFAYKIKEHQNSMRRRH